jgi:ribosomal protein S21
MSNKTRVRVEAKWTGTNSVEKAKAFKYLHTEFKRRVSDAGIMHSLKQHEFYESKTLKRRKKKREAALRRQREILEARIMAGERVKTPAGLSKKKKGKSKNDEGRYEQSE